MHEEEYSDNNLIDDEPSQWKKVVAKNDDDDNDFAFLIKSQVFIKHKESLPWRGPNLNRQPASGHQKLNADNFASSPVHSNNNFVGAFACDESSLSA